MSESKLLTEDVFLESLSLKESKDSKKRSNVLHVLEGACMEMDTVNRNNRIYPKELIVKKILNNQSTNDLMKKHCLFGEGCHPETRLETIVPNICMSVEKLWIPDKDPNKLYGRFAILDTPTGRIVNTLLEYGAKIGVSARASGTSTFTPEGYELLNIDDYEFYTFDIVTEPGFACARPNLVESKSSTSILNEYKKYNKNELSCVKNLLEKYPSVFKTELSAVKSILESQYNNNPEISNDKSNPTKKDIKLENARLKKENKSLREINKKKHIKEQTKILKLSRQVEELKQNLSECAKSNNILEKKNKALTHIVESQKKVLLNNQAQKTKNIKESISKKLKDINDNKIYESNVKFISKKTNLNESKVKSIYKTNKDSVNNALNFIEKLSPYLNEDKKPTKVVGVKELNSTQQEKDELESTKNFLESLII